MSGRLILILGGARSGKSTLAERLAEGEGGDAVLFVATAQAWDDDMRQRIARHRADRPAAWRTLEEPLALAEALRGAAGSAPVVVIDCLTLWVSNLLLRHEEDPEAERRIVEEAQALLAVHREQEATWIVVSNEVGLGVVPPTSLGRRYRDALGRVNQLVAAAADDACLLVAGLAMPLKGRTLP